MTLPVKEEFLIKETYGKRACEGAGKQAGFANLMPPFVVFIDECRCNLVRCLSTSGYGMGSSNM